MQELAWCQGRNIYSGPLKSPKKTFFNTPLSARKKPEGPYTQTRLLPRIHTVWSTEKGRGGCSNSYIAGFAWNIDSLSPPQNPDGKPVPLRRTFKFRPLAEAFEHADKDSILHNNSPSISRTIPGITLLDKSVLEASYTLPLSMQIVLRLYPSGLSDLGTVQRCRKLGEAALVRVLWWPRIPM